MYYSKLSRAVVAASALSAVLLTPTSATAWVGAGGDPTGPAPARRIVTSSETPFDAAGVIISKATRNLELEDPEQLTWPVRDTINTPFTGEHAGIDIEGETGDPIIAAASGVITYAGDDGDGYGIKIVIRHDRRISTLYSHLQDMKVTKGKVERGDVIGTVGCTGSCSGDHLHFEVLKNGTPTDPLGFLKK